MHIITKKRLKEFYKDKPEAKAPLDEWYQKLKNLRCNDLVQLRQTFPHADLVGTCIVFNVGGNKFRVITWINYEFHNVYIRNVLTHREYDQDKWKTDCYKR